MPHNSISDNLTREDILAEIRLFLGADIVREKCFLVVEGYDDILFFNGKLEKEVAIEESYSGKLGVIDIVDYFDDDRVIGILDADYEQQSISPHIFYYDYSCLEMMMISCDKAFLPFCNAYYSGEKTCYELRHKVLNDLLWLSLFRKNNTEHHWGVNFGGISFDKCYDKTTIEIKLEILDSQIQQTNSKKDISELIEYSRVVDENIKRNFSLSELFGITRGHDFFEAFKTVIKYLKMKHTPSEKELFHSIICSYRIEDFIRSRLYNSLNSYQVDKQIHIFPSKVD